MKDYMRQNYQRKKIFTGSKLNDSKCSNDDYERAMNVWTKFKRYSMLETYI